MNSIIFRKREMGQGFYPYIAMMFLNAMTDLGHKIAIQNTIFKIYDGSEQIIFTAIINASILLPYILFFSTAGYISDRFSKEVVMRYSALFAVGITAMITASYYFGEFWLAFGLTLLLATQSAIYSPAKYGYIRELLGDSRVVVGNSWVQATTIVAILFGTLFYSILFETLLGDFETEKEILQFLVPIGFLLFTASIFEFILSFKLPKKRAGERSNRPKISETLKPIFENREILNSILFLALFFSIAQVILVVFGAFIKANLKETNTIVVQGLMALSGIGIVIGSAISGKLFSKKLELKTVHFAFFTIVILVILIPFANSTFLFALIFLSFGISGGLIVVPLNSYIQLHSNSENMGKVLASNNLIQNIFMISFLGITTLFSLLEIDEIYIFYILSGVAFLSAFFAFRNRA
jgi:acyl-[acyl-carrier-protein]-phospholipid O-acyltransferase/long-chain-fatty-acid--[acyl-carrier-protein] ligase